MARYTGTCDDGPPFCLADHIAAKIGANPSERSSYQGEYRGGCPVCGSTLTIAPGESHRFVWHCMQNPHCDPGEIRAALIKAGVPDGCLGPYGTGPARTARPASQAAEDGQDAAAVAAALYTAAPAGRMRELLVAAVLRRGGIWPHGRELEAFAREVGISPDTAYTATAKATRLGFLQSGRVTVSSDQPSAGNGYGTRTTRASRYRHSDEPSAGNGSTSGFGVAVTPGVGTPVTGTPPPPAPRRRCAAPDCGRELPLDARADAQYCPGGACRQRAHKARERTAASGARITATAAAGSAPSASPDELAARRAARQSAGAREANARRWGALAAEQRAAATAPWRAAGAEANRRRWAAMTPEQKAAAMAPLAEGRARKRGGR